MKVKPVNADVGGALHSDLNAAVAFDMLCLAFAEKEPKHAAVWMGALTASGAHYEPLLAALASRASIRRLTSTPPGAEKPPNPPPE